MDEQALMAILEALAGSAPNEGFGVQGPGNVGNEPVGRLGMSPQSAITGNALNQMQGAGMAPAMPDETGSGPASMALLMQIIQALGQQNLGMVPQPGDPGVFNSSGDAAVGSDQNQELLKALLGGS